MSNQKQASTKPSTDNLTRREFLEGVVGTSLVAGLVSPELWAAGEENGIPYRRLGRTGERVSLVGLGGYHLGMGSNEQESIRIIRAALDSGINFLDNCWDYNGGASEIRMGRALAEGYRKKAFLMTKIDGQTRKAATGSWRNLSGDCRPITLTCCNSMK